MKVKLLKKIRKRYSITRIDTLASNEGEIYSWYAINWGLPFFVLDDNEDCFGVRTKFYKTYDSTRAKLCKWIIADYTDKFRYIDGKQTKVWYSEPIKKKRKFKLF
jgi:hypothetical protein